MEKVLIDGLSFAMPLLVMAIGAIYSEKSGITNLAVEGFQGFGAFVGALVAVLLMPSMGDGSQAVIYIAMLAAFVGGASPMLILKKALPTFIIATTTASSVASFGHCANSCEHKLGVNNSVTSFGTPLGIVMFPPATSLYFMLICLYAAEAYQVECSVTWFVLAIFSVTVLAIASPPIPGGTLTCYTIIFSQLGLPEEALVVALALDVLFDFLATGLNILCLQLNLVIQAKRMGLLDTAILHRQS